MFRTPLWVALAAYATSAFAQTADVPVLTVCEVLSNRLAYNGKAIIVVGAYTGWAEGSELSMECLSKLMVDGVWWSNSITLGAMAARKELSPLKSLDPRKYEATVLAKLPQSVRTNRKLVSECSYSGVWAAAYGRFETKESFPLIRRSSAQAGYGHLGAYAAQLLKPDAGLWCLVTPEEAVKVAEDQALWQERFQSSLWRAIRTQLRAPGGTEYFDAEMRGRQFPALRGVVVSTELSGTEEVIVLAMSDSTSPEATLRLDQPLARLPYLGQLVEFEGVARALALNPFMVTFEVKASGLTIRDP